MYRLYNICDKVFIQQEVLSIGILSLTLLILSCGALECYGLWQLFKHTAQLVFN